MEKNAIDPRTGRRPRWTFAPFLPLILLIGTAAADTSVYRCVAPDGKIEFRQTSCTDGAEGDELTIEDRKTGWEPGRTKITKKKKKRSSSSSSRKKTGTRSSRASKTRQKEKCWKKRQQLEDVNRKLRRGYRASEGEKLRRRRRSYEDYISEFCK